MGKRGNGEGSIYAVKKDGKVVAYRASISLGYEGAQRKRKTITRKLRKDVAAELVRLKTEQQRGINIAPKKITVGQFLEQWLTEIVEPTKKAYTFRLYSLMARGHLIPELGRLQLSRLTRDHVQALLRQELANGLAPGTVGLIRRVLCIALDIAMQRGLVPRNVAKLTTPPRVEQHQPTLLTQTEARRFLEVAKKDRLGPLYTVALALGLRIGEALALRWSDVDLKEGELVVRHTLQRIGREVKFTEPKSASSRRRLALSPTLVETLRKHHLDQLQEKFAAGKHWQEHELVFCNELGQPLVAGTVRKYLRRLLTRAGLPSMRFHDLRHCCATLLLAQNVHPKIVQSQLGHATLATTMDIYSHVLPAATRDVATLMDGLLASGE